VRDSVQFWHEADLSTYFCNVRFWGVEMPAIATGMGAKQPGGGKWPVADGVGEAHCAARRNKAYCSRIPRGPFRPRQPAEDRQRWQDTMWLHAGATVGLIGPL
jgi:hypothetical protein